LNKFSKIRPIITFILLCVLSNFSYSQSLTANDYNATLRMKLTIDKNPALYLDEPISADLEKIHKSCKVYIYLYEKKSDIDLVRLGGNEVKMNVEKMKKKIYNPNLPSKTKTNIRYHYFSVGKD
jgi:hypothetical protein